MSHMDQSSPLEGYRMPSGISRPTLVAIDGRQVTLQFTADSPDPEIGTVVLTGSLDFSTDSLLVYASIEADADTVTWAPSRDVPELEPPQWATQVKVSAFYAIVLEQSTNDVFRQSIVRILNS
jgi:hypothetical protein